jgi:phenylpyruvate tautomerase PptA (4-oxalocrotonate tautomerase family)
MPLWRIYCNPETFSPEERTSLAQTITSLYTNLGLPAFYVNVLFIDVLEQNFLIGGQRTKNTIRFSVEHVARAMPSADSEEGRLRISRWMDRISNVGSNVRRVRAWIDRLQTLKPFIPPGHLWEITTSNTPMDQWRIQGVKPPPPGSEEEKSWVKANKPVL